MQSVLDGSHPTTVHIMPMIGEKSSDYSCIYTTMVFIAKEAKRYGKHPILTFDQPLYWKAMEIQKHEKDSTVSEIVLILGSFHILMSFLGSIGHLMMGTGLQPLLEQVYAENTVPYILSGKAVSRARRAHMLAVCALEGLKVAQIYDIDLESNEENEDEFDLSTRFMQHPELHGLADILQKSLSKDIGVDQLTEQHIFKKLLINHDLFNRMLTEYINNGSSGLSAIQENGDADYLLAKTAVSQSQQKDVVVISAGTDVLILLLHHANSSSAKGLFLTSESTSSSKSPPKCWNIPQIKRSLGDEVCESILQIHAILGCDTTSRIHGIGKGASLKRFQKDEHFREYLIKFSNSSASQEEVAEAGECALLMLYGERSEANLNNIRYDAFCKKISTSSKAVLPENLPPTSDAARFHSFRVFHQVQRWKGVLLPALDWGWIMKGNFLLSKLMSQALAPIELLKLIKCNCKSGCAPNSNCSCQKNNLKCTPMCGSCKAVSCCNHQEIDDTDTVSEEN